MTHKPKEERVSELAEVEALIAEEQRNQIGCCVVHFDLMVRIASRLTELSTLRRQHRRLTEMETALREAREALEAGARLTLWHAYRNSYEHGQFLVHASRLRHLASLATDLASLACEGEGV